MTHYRSDIAVTASAWSKAALAHLRAAAWSLLLVPTCLALLATSAAGETYTSAISIENTATVLYSVGSLPRDAVSNEVSTQVCTQATLEFLKYAPGLENSVTQSLSETLYCPAGSSCDPASAEGYVAVLLHADAATDPRNQPLALIKVDTSHPYHVGDLIFAQLTDGDRNNDPAIAEQIGLVLSYDNEQEKLLLTETGPDTGIFAGYIQSARPGKTPLVVGDGIFTITKSEALGNTPIIASYDDICETVDGVNHIEIEAEALVDPFGIFFDSRTGLPIDGATVTLIDVLTGQPALVLGDDGVSTYPATIVSGGSVTDSSGEVYSFPPGFYRYPFLSPGTYRLDVVPPAGYTAPSAVDTVELQMLPAAPFAIEPGSRGEVFIVNPGPALHIDIPLDPKLAALWVTKSADSSTVAIGDFLRYTITVENTIATTANNVIVSDRLPPGFRYRKGSTRIAGNVAADPSIGDDGRTLLFTVGPLEPDNSLEIRFVTEIGVGAKTGKATNFASASADNSTDSNTAHATVQVTDDLFRGAAFIVGRVFPNGCSEEQNMPGVSGVRIYLEEGLYAVTDKNGKYHFAGVTPGTHVVQIDLTSIPDSYELVACEDNTRFAETPYSQYVDVQGGTLWRADFYLAKKKVQIKGDVGLELKSTLSVDSQTTESENSTEIVLRPRFQSGSAELSTEDKTQLDRVAASLKGLKIEQLQVTGHTDPQRISARLRPVYPDNYALSRARAASVADYLVAALALDPALVTSDGKGPSDPVASNSTPGGMARNRRVELLVTALQTRTEVVKSRGEIKYDVPIATGAAPLANVRLSIMLPAGVSSIAGTSKLDEKPFPDPENRGEVLTYRLGDLPADWQGVVHFSGQIKVEGEVETFKTQALLTFDTVTATNQRTPLVDNLLERNARKEIISVPPIVLHPRFESGSAVLSPGDRTLLDGIALQLKDLFIKSLLVTGHTDSQRISARLRPVYPDNHALSMARAESVGQYLAAALSLAPEQILSAGKGSSEPVAKNDTPENMALNRRVELHINAEEEQTRYELKNTKDKSGIEKAAFDETVDWDVVNQAGIQAKTASGKGSTAMPEFDSAWLKKAEPGLAFVWPPVGFHPSLPVVKVAVKHDPQRKLTLRINGQPVAPFFLDGTQKRDDLLVALTQWFGVSVKEGSNLFEAVEYNRDGSEGQKLTLNIHYSGPPVRVELLADQSRAIADGKNPAVIAIRLTDKDGHPARQGVVGEFKIDSPYIPYQKTLDLQKQPLTMSTSEWSRYEVGADGVALIQVHPTTQTGEAVVHFNLVSGEEEVRTWLKPEYRDWILVGLAEGTVGYNTATGNMESLSNAGEEENFYDDGRVAFFAKGKIKGEWLMTMAYDSAKKPLDGRPGLYQSIDPNQYYLLYGDETDQRHDAASAKKVYVKLERSQFYALFGDYASGLSVTELSRYNRSLTGIKSEMKGKTFSYSAFAADTNQAFVKDELRGDGTSGLYHLSRRNMVLNSEKVTIETRDRFRSDVIISSHTMMRSLDYNIDYDDGTLFFKAPVFTRDADFNPVYIVVEYESFDATDTAWIYGGRGAVKFFGNQAEVGATYVHEGVTGGGANLIGADATIAITPETKLRTEVATTNSDIANVSSQGTAWLAEVEHQSERVDGTLYVREQESGFGLGQQAGSETGTRKMGGDINYHLTKPWSTGLSLLRQENLATGAIRDMAEVHSDYTADRYSLLGGLRHAEDSLGTGNDMVSEQIFADITYRLTERLSTQLRHEQSVYTNDNVDYPTRTTLGADYKLSEDTTLTAAQEWTHGDSVATESTRIGIRTAPWTGGQLGSTVEQQTSENGSRLFATTGLKQTWQLSSQWSLDAGLDRTDTLRTTTKRYDINANVPDASGSDNDYTAISLGAGYVEEKWSWTGRVENRLSRVEEKFSLFTGATGEVRDGLALAGSVQSFLVNGLAGSKRASHNLRLALGYRPLTPRTIILDRLEYIEDSVKSSGSSTDSQRIVNNLVTNIKLNQRTQLAVQFGIKYVLAMIDKDKYRGFIDLYGVEGRYDLTKNWDVGLHGSVLHSWSLDQMQFGSGASVGFSPVKNVWLTGGYNFTGYQDEDFSRANFTAQGPFMKFRIKFDQNSLRDTLKQF